MLFGTFLKEDDDDYKYDADTMEKFIRNKAQTPDTGKPFVWTFPIDGVKEGTIRALLSPAEDADILCLIESDDYVKTNMPRHVRMEKIYKAIGREYTVDDLRDDSADDVIADYAVNADSLKVKGILYLDSAASFTFRKEDFDGFMPYVKDIRNDTEDMIRGDLYYIMGQAVPQGDLKKFLHSRYGIEDPDIDDEVAYMARAFRIASCILMVPFLIRMATRKSSGAWWFLSAATKASQLITCRSQAEEWADGDCDEEEFRRIFETACQYVTDNNDVLKYISKEGDPGRNDPCPCGSGKKFKSCHGRYLGKTDLLVSLTTPAVTERMERRELMESFAGSLTSKHNIILPGLSRILSNEKIDRIKKNV